MSKAFTRESESETGELVRPPSMFTLPPGVKNYMTSAGARQLREELDRLIEDKRSRPTDTTERKHEWAGIDQRIKQLEYSLSVAEIVQPPENPNGVVRFGATVTVRDPSGRSSHYRIVGIDEVDTDRNWISWRSPVAKALLNKNVGDQARFAVPDGERRLEITRVEYDKD